MILALTYKEWSDLLWQVFTMVLLLLVILWLFRL